jgi:16S rRNA (cytidine1402-2'-O)-methyltransferase
MYHYFTRYFKENVKLNLSGKLYIVSTPIGNLGDISFRCLETLKTVNVIACEDTRVTKKILHRYTINAKLITYNSINESKQVYRLIERLNSGENIALVSDAGTPCISDPGYRLVHDCHLENIEVVSVPGPSSVIAALSISGLPTDSFYFCGFLPRKKGRKTKFEFLVSLPTTVIVYESPHRVLKTLKDIYSYMGDRNISVCREITKMYEEVLFDSVSSVINNFEERNSIKGEFVILISKEGYKIK